jgi:MoaA/NifB/PqqE/SkfB family radical SAM enzyme
MFNFSELKSVHLEITSRCQASCPMCSRNYRGGLDNPNLKIADWSIEDFRNIFTEQVINQINGVYFCGNFGDPIINNDLIEMCKHLSIKDSHVNVRIHTNGGARNANWWRELRKSLTENHSIIFGIDGLEDTHHLYRIGTSYDQVIANAKTFIDAGGNAEWAFIKFKHNEHQVEEAEKRAKDLGFRSFTVKNSTRFMEDKFKVLDKNGNVSHYLEPPSKNEVILIDPSMIKKFESWVEKSEIKCYVQNTKEIYIDAQKNMFPCCFLASTPYNYNEPNSLISPIKDRIKYQYDDLVKDLDGIENLNLDNRSIKDIIDSSSWQSVWNSYWTDKKLITCARTCGTVLDDDISKPKDQFVKRINFE